MGQVPAPILPSIPVLQAMRTAGLSYREIGQQFGVGPRTVGQRFRSAGIYVAKPTVEERFWAKVDKDGPGGCWLWTAAQDGHGYGHFNFRRRPIKAYRFAWELSRGPVPEGLTLDHLCRVKICVNPAHLAVATQRENILRSSGVSAVHAAKSHCIHGHEFTEDNVYAYRGDRRICRQCMKDRKQAPAYKAQQRAAQRARYYREKAAT